MEYKYASAPKLLNAALGQRSKLEVLRCLSAERDELAGREIARRVGLSHLAVLKALRELEEEGIVERRITPPTHQFKLNRRHWVVGELLIPLFEKEASWGERMERFLARGAPEEAISIILFGSAARGRLAPRSDVDVLVIVKEERDKAAVRAHFQDKSGEVYAAFRHPLSALVMTRREFVGQYRTGKGFAKEVAVMGRVIHGRLLTEVLFEHGAKKD